MQGGQKNHFLEAAEAVAPDFAEPMMEELVPRFCEFCQTEGHNEIHCSAKTVLNKLADAKIAARP